MQQVFVCPRCGTQNVLGQRFCIGCGQPLTVFCPYCGTSLPPTAGFCTNCGAQLRQISQPQAGGGKPASGWTKFGSVLFVLGVLCAVIGPASLLLRPPAEQTTGAMIGYFVGGALAIIISIPLMFKR